MATIKKEVIDAAQASERKWKIPASLSLAQYGLESGWGTRMPAGSNNPFGIKATGTQPFVQARTREEAKGNQVAALSKRADVEQGTIKYIAARKVTEYYLLKAKFRKFANIAEAFDSHGKLLGTSKYYANMRTKYPDPFAMAHALTGIYATATDYGDKLVDIMRGNNLYQYDKQSPAVVDTAAPPAPPLVLDAGMVHDMVNRLPPASMAPVAGATAIATEVLGPVEAAVVEAGTTVTKTADTITTVVVEPRTGVTKIKRMLSGWQGNLAGGVAVVGGLLLDPTFSRLLGDFTTRLAAGGGKWGAIATIAGAALVAYRRTLPPPH